MLYKLVRGGISGAIAFVIANIVSNLLFFQIGKPVLFNPDLQSEKLIAVLFEMEPLPLMFTNGSLYLTIAAFIGIIHGLVFTYIEPSLPKNKIKRGAVRGSDLEEGESQGLPVWSYHVGDPILKSNLMRRVDFALFMVEALENDDLIQQAPAIVGCLTPSALANQAVSST